MSKKILIIDDDFDLVKGLTIKFESEGYKIVHAFDGENGIKELSQKTPDLIILDLMMPKMVGHTFVNKVKSREDLKDIPIIIITGQDNQKFMLEREAMSGIISDYLIKPFQFSDLLNKVAWTLK